MMFVYIGCHSDLSNNQLVSLPELAFANLTDLNTLLVARILILCILHKLLSK